MCGWGFFSSIDDDDDDDAIVPSCVLEAPLDEAAMVPDSRTRSVCFRSLFSQMPLEIEIDGATLGGGDVRACMPWKVCVHIDSCV